MMNHDAFRKYWFEGEEMAKYKVYVDMDGVLADFVKGVNELLGKQCSDEEYMSNPQYRKEMWNAVTEYSRTGGRLWAELDLMPDAKELWNYVERYNPEILSSTGGNADAGVQKCEWIPKNIGKNIKVNLVENSRLKYIHADHNSILIDDHSKSINPWILAGGIGILHTSAKDTIKELKKLGL